MRRTRDAAVASLTAAKLAPEDEDEDEAVDAVTAEAGVSDSADLLDDENRGRDMIDSRFAF